MGDNLVFGMGLGVRGGGLGLEEVKVRYREVGVGEGGGAVLPIVLARMLGLGPGSVRSSMGSVMVVRPVLPIVRSRT